MPKKPRPPRLEKTCPLEKTHTRLHQVHEHWHRVAADYPEPDDFVTSLNAALVMLRSVSFMLNKEKERVPDFESWYEPHIDRYATDPLMRWLKEARNFVEKEGDLELHSTARVRLLGAPGEPPEGDINADPLLTQHEIAEMLASMFPRAAKHNGLLSVERRWVAASLPEHELLDVLAHGYGVVAEVVADAHKQCGVLMQTFGDEAHEDRPRRREHLGGRLSCMVAHANRRTAYVHLAEQRVVEWATRTRHVTREDLADFKSPPGLETMALQLHKPGEHLLDAAEGWVEPAKVVTTYQGGHYPMALVFETRDDAPEIHNYDADDHATQTLMMESLAHDVERLRAEGVIFIAETNQAGSQGDQLLVAAVTDDGGRRQWRTPLVHDADGKVSMGETMREDDVVPDFMNAVRRVWVALGRDPS